MSSEFQIFVYISVGLFFLVIAEAIIILAGKYLLGLEGMHFLKSRWAGNATDTLRHSPLTNKLSLGFAQWDGEKFYNKLGFYYPLRSVLNPETESQKIYNKSISTASRWSGSGRPVVMMSDLFGFGLSSDFFAKLSQAKNSMDQEVLNFINKLETLFNNTQIEYFSFIDTFDLNDIHEYLISAGPERMEESYKKGIRREKLKNTNLKTGGGFPVPWIIIAVVVMLAVAYFAQKAISSGAIAF